MRIRLNYVANGAPVVEQAEVNNFPTISWQWLGLPSVNGPTPSYRGGTSHVYVIITTVNAELRGPLYSRIHDNWLSLFPRQHTV